MAGKFKKLRKGLYILKLADKEFEIEKLDKQSEVYPGDDYYNSWRVYEYHTKYFDIWLTHFETLASAKEAITKQEQDTKLL